MKKQVDPKFLTELKIVNLEYIFPLNKQHFLKQATFKINKQDASKLDKILDVEKKIKEQYEKLSKVEKIKFGPLYVRRTGKALPTARRTRKIICSE